jgi:hypothetical protein
VSYVTDCREINNGVSRYPKDALPRFDTYAPESVFFLPFFTFYFSSFSNFTLQLKQLKQWQQWQQS